MIAPSLRASGTDFAGLRNAGLVGIVEALITANAAATAAPTSAPTATATGGGSAGGLLAAGAYFLKITEVNGVGETTASPESSQLTVSAGNIPRVTFPALKTGNTARNLYLTAAGGSTGTEVLYASGVTAGTLDLATAAPASTVAPPTANTTALSQAQINRIRKATHSPDRAFPRTREDVDNFTSGTAVATADVLRSVVDGWTVFALLQAAVGEAAALVAANPGTLGTSIGSTGFQNTRRTWS